MASRHCSFKTGKAGKGGGHAAYISGLGQYADRDDVVAVIEKNLPGWAGNGAEFFAAADKFERKNGRAYSEIEAAIPRGVADPVEFAETLARRLLGNRHPYCLAVHDKVASDGGRNVHMHLMFSERRLDGVERNEVQFFARANKKNPELGGTAKDRMWNDRAQIQFVRDVFQHHALKCGVEIDLRSNAKQGLGEPEPKIGPKHKREAKIQTDARKARKAKVADLRFARRQHDVTMPVPATESPVEALKAVETSKSTSKRPAPVKAPLRASKPQPKPENQNSNHSVQAPTLEQINLEQRHQAQQERQRQKAEREQRLAAAEAAKQAAAAEVTQSKTLLEQLKAALLALIGRVIELREGPVKHDIGTVIVANERWAAMDIGLDMKLIDRKEWPVEAGHSYTLRDGQGGKQIEARPVTSNMASKFERIYGPKVGAQASEWAERDKALTLPRNLGRSR
jgi:hypothetical protein